MWWPLSAGSSRPAGGQPAHHASCHQHALTGTAPARTPPPHTQGRLGKDISKLVGERAELADKVASLQAQVFKHNEKLDGYKLLMNWNEEEMEQWALAQRQKEEDNSALEKYKHQDAAKVRPGARACACACLCVCVRVSVCVFVWKCACPPRVFAHAHPHAPPRPKHTWARRSRSCNKRWRR